MPSRFIDELPEKHVEVIMASEIYGSSPDLTVNSSNLETEAFQADGYDSPGWKRLQTNKKQTSLSKPTESTTIIVNGNSDSIFAIGERVFHQKFGYGIIKTIEGENAEVAFSKTNLKKVKKNYLIKNA